MKKERLSKEEHQKVQEYLETYGSSELSKKKKSESTVMEIFFATVLVLAVMLFINTSCSESDEERAERVAQEAEDKKKGRHCLSLWDGRHSAFTNMVKARLRDPDSFEHILTLVTPVNASGRHRISMTYRARNGFGGMNTEVATGSYSNASCIARLETLD